MNRYKNYYLQCVACGKIWDEKKTSSRCLSCKGPLEVIYDYGLLKSRLNTYLLENATPKVMKYLDFYPLERRVELFSLDEGGTTLHHAKRLGGKMGIPNLFIKNEGLNPTGAFKDRGSFIEVNKAKELGYKTICVASTGNMAASVSAYSSQAGLECLVFVPEGTPKSKLAQTLSYGGKVIQISGTYNEANAICEKIAQKRGYYLAGDYVFRAEGQKSLGYELVQQRQGMEIDYVIVPVGMGTNFSSIWKGFWEFEKLGLLKKIPKMIAVQSAGAHTIFKRNGKYYVTAVEKPQTVCSAIAVGDPLDAPKVIRALKESDGEIETATDDEVLSAQQLLSHMESLYLEPSASTTIAALNHLIQKGIIKNSDTVVCVATGIGLKDPGATLKVVAEPPTVEPDIDEVEKVINARLFSIRAQGVREKEKVLFSVVPDLKELEKVIRKEFTLDISGANLKIVFSEIKTFIMNKGKNIAKADLQSILEAVIQQESKKKYLVLEDFYIQNYLNRRPLAEVKVELNGVRYKSESEGVGPVDAAINAIRKVIEKYDGVDFKLSDFSVEIPTTGTDATVEVTMNLKEKNGTEVIEKGTSPDIIVASIEAFVKGYNELIYQLKERGKNVKK